jgi:hypothetical protein
LLGGYNLIAFFAAVTHFLQQSYLTLTGENGRTTESIRGHVDWVFLLLKRYLSLVLSHELLCVFHVRELNVLAEKLRHSCAGQIDRTICVQRYWLQIIPGVAVYRVSGQNLFLPVTGAFSLVALLDSGSWLIDFICGISRSDAVRDFLLRNVFH